MHKTFVIDTNVLIYDPDAIKKFKNNDVVIPVIVLEELNNLKRNSDEAGKQARAAIRYIDSLKSKDNADFNKGICIPEGPKVRICVSVERQTAFPLPLDRNSNKILQIALALKSGGENAVLVSKDFITRIKGEALGLLAEDYENLKVQYEDIYRGFKRKEIESAEMEKLVQRGYLEAEDFLSNEYCLVSSGKLHSIVCRYNHNNKRLETLAQNGSDLFGIKPLNVEQRCVIDLLLRDDVKLITLVGHAGTGKTLLALACGLSKVFHENVYSKILVSRPIIPLGKDIGYLPGTKEEKLYHWMQPIYDNLEFLCQSSSEENTKSTLKWILESQKIEMEAVTYIRGRSLPRMYMIVDEAQNLTPHEVKTIISRAGMGSKVILTGDPTQIDNPYLDQDSNGLTYTVGKFKGEHLFGHIFLSKTERSELAALAINIM